MTTPVGFPMVNAGSLYVNGLQMAWGTNTTITVNAGAARDASNQDDIILPSSVTVNAAVNGINGLDTGSLAASTFYAVYLVGSSLSANPELNIATQATTNGSGSSVLNGIVVSTGAGFTPTYSVANNPQPGVMLSTSLTAPTYPAGYDMCRRIGFVLTDGSSHILPFWQVGNGASRIMYYDALISVLSGGTSATFAAVDLSSAVPVTVARGYQAEVIFDAIVTPTGAGDKAAFRPTGSSSTNGLAIMSGDAAGVAHEDTIQLPAAIASSVLKVDYKVTGSLSLKVAGYFDQL